MILEIILITLTVTVVIMGFVTDKATNSYRENSRKIHDLTLKLERLERQIEDLKKEKP